MLSFHYFLFQVDIFESSPAREPEISLLAAQLSHKGVKTYKVCKENRTLVKRRTLCLRPTRISEYKQYNSKQKKKKQQHQQQQHNTKPFKLGQGRS